MLLDIDTIIFVSFLVINLGVGLFYSRGVKTVREYSIGNRDFSTGTITTTVVATYVGAGFITAALTESYRQGLYFIIPVLGEPLALVVTGYFLVPRMKEFFGKTSVAEAMGELYGKNIRIITALVGVFRAAGIVALQFKVSSTIMQLFFGVSSFYAVTSSAVLVTFYSSLGGIKAVTFTDIIQAFCFCVIIPIICLSIWTTCDASQVAYTISHSALFDFKEVLSPYNSRFLALVCLFLYFIIPSVDPAYFQRISMSKGVTQCKRSFIIAGAVSVIMLLIVCWTSILLLSQNSTLDSTNLLSYILENYTTTGLKGLAAISLMAAIMSTADSYLNSASVLFIHDAVEPMISGTLPKKMLLLKLSTAFIGIVALTMAYRAEGFFQILVMTMSVYMPTVSVPLLLAIFGIRSNTKVVLIGMACGILTALFWSNLYSFAQMDGFSSEVLEETNEAIPAMLANLIAFIIAHLIYGKPEGKRIQGYEEPLLKPEQQHKQNYGNFINTVKHFSPTKLIKENFAKQEYFYVSAGIFAAISILSQAYLIKDQQRIDVNLFTFIYASVLVCSFVLIIFPILPSPYQKKLSLLRALVIPYILVFTPLLLSITSKFGQIQTTVLLLSILVFVSIVRWKLALVVFALTSLISFKFSQIFTDLNASSAESLSIIWQYKIIYALLLASAVIIAFLKPKQEEQERSEEMVEHLSHVVEDQNEQITNLSTLKQTFLMNLQHETNTPITGVYSMSQALGDCYDKLTDKERKRAIATITASSERLISYCNNLIDTSKIMSSHYKLNLRPVNLSTLLEERIRKCRKLYIPKEAEEDRDIILSIEPNITADCDEYLIKRSFENLIINSIQYCKKGKISISLTKEGDEIKLIVKDTGLGIPNDELTNIFNPFVTSSKTATPAGGRGMGLTLVKAAAEIHKGTITASSSKEGGSIFTLNFPGKYREAEEVEVSAS